MVVVLRVGTVDLLGVSLPFALVLFVLAGAKLRRAVAYYKDGLCIYRRFGTRHVVGPHFRAPSCPFRGPAVVLFAAAAIMAIMVRVAWVVMAVGRLLLILLSNV